MVDNRHAVLRRFLTRSTAAGWVALLSAVLLMALIGRGFINTPEQTVTPLSEYSARAGTLEEISCGQTSTGKTVLLFQIDERDSALYELRVGRDECAELLKLIQEDSEIKFWVHPSIPGWVGQLAVDQEVVVPHSRAYEEAWRSRWVSLWVGLVISFLLIYYAFRGQFKESLWSGRI